ncbi:MAG: SLC13 family permease, partial [Gammaproteobacteria bacterium]|nr:SLC13 family permease [Gammaproteobacteria bacterium]
KLVDPSEAFVGFGHPAVITVAAVLVISHALKNSGVVDLIAQKLIPLTEHQLLHIAALTAVVTVASAFMNNVGALALMLPVALATAGEHNRSPAILLMPLAFGSILGGMTTMIGTPPNIIIASYRAEVADAPFLMFDFSGVGLVVAVLGVVFITLFGWHLIPKERRSKNAPQQLFAIDDYLTEVRIPEDSVLIGKSPGSIEVLDSEGIDIIGLARGHGRAMATPADHVLSKGDVLILRADPKGVKKLIDEEGVELVTSATQAFYDLTSDDLTLAEGVITVRSPLEGRDVAYLRRRSGNAVALVALARQGKAVRRRLRRQQFKAGDVMLLQGDAATMEEMFNHLGLLPLAERELRIGRPQRVGLALSIFAAAIALGVAGIMPTAVAFVLAIVVYVLLGILPARDIYKEIDWPVIILLGAMIPVGRALEQTGATTLVANSIVELTSGLPVFVVLGLVLVVTMFLSDIINNAATALVMAPISVAIAENLDVSIDPFLMAVAVGASCAFLTPIGHQSNTLVMGPGGYRFTDYWRMGLPLEVLIVLVGIPMILIVWPLNP